MQVDHGGGDLFMAQELLDRVQVRARLQEMSGEAMTQRLLTLLISSRCKQYITGITRFTGLKSP
jgi:hypothetical protein